MSYTHTTASMSPLPPWLVLLLLSCGLASEERHGSCTGKLKDSHDKKVICYFPSWAAYRTNGGAFQPQDIDTTLCTHVMYSFAALSNSTFTIESLDTELDVGKGYFEKVASLKENGTRVMLALGGWTESAGNKYSLMVNNRTNRRGFVASVTKFLDKYGFEGLDLDWEYPRCWQGDCTAGPATDRLAFALLVRELRAAFKPFGWLLSCAVSANRNVADVAYVVKSLSRNLDWIGVMAYDYYGNWNSHTGHVAPLYQYPGDTPDYFNANSSVRYYLAAGAKRDKLVLGMPFYGQSFTLANASDHGMHANTTGAGKAGDQTQSAGTLSYSEICYGIKTQAGWTVVRDPEGRIGPYAYRDDQWVSYDDVQDLRRKSQYVLDVGLGGAMVWALGSDDFAGRCGCGKQPLLRAVNSVLRPRTAVTGSDCT